MKRFFAVLCITATLYIIYADDATDVAVAASEALLSSFTPQQPEIVSAKNNALGGYHTAYTHNEIESLFSNPATLSSIRKSRWSFAVAGMDFSGPFFDIMDTITSNSDDVVNDVLTMVAESNVSNINLNIAGPIALGYSCPNIAFGLYNQTIISLSIPSITSMTFCSGEEMMLTCGYGSVIFETSKTSFSAGISLNGYMQMLLYKKDTLSNMINYIDDFDIHESPSLFVSGFGFSLGLLYNIKDTFMIGLQYQNPYGFAAASGYADIDAMLDTGESLASEYYRQKSDLSLGFCWEPDFPIFRKYITRCDLMFDYHNILDLFPGYTPIPRNPILNTSFGLEVVIHDVLSLRTGIRDCYFSAGLGLDLTWCILDFAVYGKELGIQPGQHPCYNLTVSMSFTY